MLSSLVLWGRVESEPSSTEILPKREVFGGRSPCHDPPFDSISDAKDWRPAPSSLARKRGHAPKVDQSGQEFWVKVQTLPQTIDLPPIADLPTIAFLVRSG